MADVVWDGMAAAAAEPVVVVRYGEVGLKGENRPVFEKLLARQVERALAGVPSARVERSHGRLFAVGVNGRAEVLERLQRVFGVVSVSPALRVAAALPAIEEAARRLVAEELERRPGVRTFKVAARRSEKRFPMDSPSLNRHLGAVLLRAFPSLSVDVHHPDLTVAVEVRERAYVSCATLPGPGGLPLGASGRAH
ncbi:MAG: tRNA 4-thiouridine(8) synthase ThiI, partial [Clostridia bacterium]|nr:tRNA 4-thiouridine(8) synthase ThiI [Clostridia bacterium]